MTESCKTDVRTIRVAQPPSAVDAPGDGVWRQALSLLAASFRVSPDWFIHPDEELVPFVAPA